MHLRPKAEQLTFYRRSRGPAFVRLAVAVALVTAVVAPGLPASAAPTWSVVASPSPVGPPSGTLRSVTCPSIDRCFAVGFYGPDGPNLKTLIERWNGTSWSDHDQPQPCRRDRQHLERRVMSEHDELLRRWQLP